MRVVPVVLAVALVACSEPQRPPDPPRPPQVFLVAPKTNVVGTSFTVRINVTGCTVVQQVQLEQNRQTFRTVTYMGPNTEVLVGPGDLGRFYGTVGIAADLTLTARAFCDDGRENRSTPLAVKFFPVASAVEPSGGRSIMLPDSFVAEGGVAAAPVTFIGCARVGGGLGLVRMNTQGDLAAACPGAGCNTTLPFACDYYGAISEKVAGGLRWLYQPKQGAIAFDQNLNVTGGLVLDSIGMFAAAPDGDAIVWDSEAATTPAVVKVRRNMGIAGRGGVGMNVAWESTVPGIVNGQPAFDGLSGTVLIPSWRVPLTGAQGSQTVQTVNYMNGQIVGEFVVVMQRFEALQPQLPPQVAFSPDGRTLYVAVPIQGNPNQSAVIACGTQGSGTGCVPRWRSPTLDGIVLFILPFANGTKIAAISENKVWFLNESSLGAPGAVLNPNGAPTAASGTLLVSGAQPGLGNDFYLLTGTPFATEIIAFDTPSNGEVWRYALGGGGSTAQDAITMAIDDAGAAWLRIGTSQVKPLTLTEYRDARGATGGP